MQVHEFIYENDIASSVPKEPKQAEENTQQKSSFVKSVVFRLEDRKLYILDCTNLRLTEMDFYSNLNKYRSSLKPYKKP